MNIVQNKTIYRTTFNLLRGFLDMLLEIPESYRNTPMIEIGSAIGETTRIFSLFFYPVYSIDPFIDRRETGEKDEFLKRISGRNIINIPMTSDDAVDHVPGKVSFVYMDGNHTKDFVRRDIKNYLPKVFNGGYIGGHDYGNKGNIQVQPAVDSMIGKPDKIFIDGSWLKRV